ncbi:MAG: OsmC family protein [Gammaproteobacteria bacterium]|nr:OsmC family protein [Gammaproteobacteria bacterium]
MSELAIELSWTRQEETLTPQKYSNEHTVKFGDKYSVKADAAPDWGGNAENTNPEQALASGLSSCHMMTFLALAAKAKWPVAAYQDRAVAHLGKNDKGQMVVTKIDLHPRVAFDAGFDVSDEQLEQMQERAHRYCFIANTLAGNVEMTIS